MSERRFSSMPPHSLSLRLHSIPPGIRGGNRPGVSLGVGRNRSIVNRRPVDDLYGAGFSGDVSGHVVKNRSRVNPRPKRFDEYIRFVEVMADVTPGKPLSVIAQLSGVTITGEFVPQPAKTTKDTLVLAAKARIGLQEGFFAVSAEGKTLKMRVEDAAGPLQEVSVEMPSYDPNKLVVEYRNSLVIASAR